MRLVFALCILNAFEQRRQEAAISRRGAYIHADDALDTLSIIFPINTYALDTSTLRNEVCLMTMQTSIGHPSDPDYSYRQASSDSLLSVKPVLDPYLEESVCCSCSSSNDSTERWNVCWNADRRPDCTWSVSECSPASPTGWARVTSRRAEEGKGRNDRRAESPGCLGRGMRGSRMDRACDNPSAEVHPARPTRKRRLWHGRRIPPTSPGWRNHPRRGLSSRTMRRSDVDYRD